MKDRRSIAKMCAQIALWTLVAWAAIAIAQIWLEFLSVGLFVKVSITGSIIVVISGLIAAVLRDADGDVDLKRDGYLG